LAGGSSLEFFRGEFTRDHQDHDIAIYYEDVEDFFEYAQRKGYKFISVESEEIASKEKLMAQRENAFLQKADSTKPGLQGFEIMFLKKNNQGEIIFGGDESVSFPVSVYEQSPRLTPPEVQLLYKLFGGRHKDFQDLKQYLPTLSAEQRERFDQYIQEAGARFEIEGQEAKNVEQLIQLAEATTPQFKEGFVNSGAIKETVTKQSSRFNSAMEKIFSAASQAENVNEFLRAVEKKLGSGIISTHKNKLEAAADFLLKLDRPTLEDFKTYGYREFELKEFLAKRLKERFLDTKRWAVKSKS